MQTFTCMSLYPTWKTTYLCRTLQMKHPSSAKFKLKLKYGQNLGLN